MGFLPFFACLCRWLFLLLFSCVAAKTHSGGIDCGSADGFHFVGGERYFFAEATGTVGCDEVVFLVAHTGEITPFFQFGIEPI